MNGVKLLKLHIQNFRNIENAALEFSESLNCIFGNNGNGKTNILESIYYLIKKKSFKKNTDFAQILNINYETPEIILYSYLNDFTNEKKIAYTGKITFEGSQWYLDNKIVKRTKISNIIFINPFDSYSFHTVNSFRREWFDNYFSELDSDYKKLITNYAKVLRHRNTLLSKKPLDYQNQIAALDIQYVELIHKITTQRNNYVADLNEILPKIFDEIFGESLALNLIYESNFKSLDTKNIKSKLEMNFEKDNIMGHSFIGSHKDKYILKINGINSYEYSSLGQQKMSFLSLIFAYIELFRYKFKTYPIILIDDVSGELDALRWRKLINFLQTKNFQVFITTANDAFRFELEKISDSKKFYIDDGKIIYKEV